MSTRTQARAAIVREVGQPWTIEAVEVSAPQEDEVLVRMVGTGICHTDMGCRDGHFPVPMPIVLGHEGAGVVEAVGANVSKVKVGDHVVLSFDSCGECHSCDKHLPSYCYTFYPRNLAGVRQDGSATLTQNGTPLNAVFFAQSSSPRLPWPAKSTPLSSTSRCHWTSWVRWVAAFRPVPVQR